jgi:hydrogenase nickel incorporation protein HypA/HybF
MHEWALAEAVVSAASETARKEGLKRVTEVRVKVGELQQIESKVFRFAFLQVRGVTLEGARLVIVKEQARMRCRACGKAWTFNRERLGEEVSEAIHFVPEVAHAYVKCPRCGSPDFEVLEGRGIWLLSVKGVK